MVGAAVLALLPARWTGCTGGVLQPLSPLTWAFSSATRQVRGAVHDLSSPAPTRAELERLRRENERLARQVGHQQVMLAEMEQVVAELSELRSQLSDGDAKIIFASVIGGDTSPWRETITISKGRRAGVEAGDWVAAGVVPAERNPATTGRDLLLQQWLIGRVSEVQPHLSRVQLTTDPHFGLEPVWAAKALADGSWQVADRQCGLVGLGGGRMRIEQASEDYSASDYTVVLVPLAHTQPMTLAIGRIVASEMLETGLHYDLEVEPWGDPRALSYVYVIATSR